MSSLLLLSFPLLQFLANSLNRGSAKRIESDRIVKSDQESGVEEKTLSREQKQQQQQHKQQKQQQVAEKTKQEEQDVYVEEEWPLVDLSKDTPSNSYIIIISSVLLAVAVLLLVVQSGTLAVVIVLVATVVGVALTAKICYPTYQENSSNNNNNNNNNSNSSSRSEKLARGRSYPVTYDKSKPPCQLRCYERHHHHPTTIYVNFDPIRSIDTGYISRPFVVDPVHQTRLFDYYNYFLNF